MMQGSPDIVGDSPAWLSFIWIAFTTALGLMLLGIYFIPVDWWVKGSLYMGTLFLTASTLTLSKSLRDWHEHERLVNRVKSAHTEQVLSKFDTLPVACTRLAAWPAACEAALERAGMPGS